MVAPVGFRFCPTDIELVTHYLRKRNNGDFIAENVILDVDLYKREPWDLPALSLLDSADEWFFFSPKDKKYPNGHRTNRATEKGFWKATGRDRPVKAASQIVGMKKTLVFYQGRAPKGERTDWLMYEYRLSADENFMFQDGFVICRVLKKHGDARVKSVLDTEETDAEDQMSGVPERNWKIVSSPAQPLRAEPLQLPPLQRAPAYSPDDAIKFVYSVFEESASNVKEENFILFSDLESSNISSPTFATQLPLAGGLSNMVTFGNEPNLVDDEYLPALVETTYSNSVSPNSQVVSDSPLMLNVVDNVHHDETVGESQPWSFSVNLDSLLEPDSNIVRIRPRNLPPLRSPAAAMASSAPFCSQRRIKLMKHSCKQLESKTSESHCKPESVECEKVQALTFSTAMDVPTKFQACTIASENSEVTVSSTQGTEVISLDTEKSHVLTSSVMPVPTESKTIPGKKSEVIASVVLASERNSSETENAHVLTSSVAPLVPTDLLAIPCEKPEVIVNAVTSSKGITSEGITSETEKLQVLAPSVALLVPTEIPAISYDKPDITSNTLTSTVGNFSEILGSEMSARIAVRRIISEQVDSRADSEESKCELLSSQPPLAFETTASTSKSLSGGTNTASLEDRSDTEETEFRAQVRYLEDRSDTEEIEFRAQVRYEVEDARKLEDQAVGLLTSSPTAENTSQPSATKSRSEVDTYSVSKPSYISYNNCPLAVVARIMGWIREYFHLGSIY